MFTGIVEEIGVVKNIAATAAGRRIVIESKTVAAGVKPGESVSVNGVCLTAVGSSDTDGPDRKGRLVADILQRTWELTNLSKLKPGAKVNLEGALRVGERIGGHFVLGHVDDQGVVESRGTSGGDVVLGVSVKSELEDGLVPRGSVAIDGVSLTIARVQRGIFYVHLIPFTANSTTLGSRTVGSSVNIELDILGKFVKKQSPETITEEFLRKKGFL